MTKEESWSISTLPYFNGMDYGYWKARMTIFLNYMDDRVWCSIVEGYTIPNTPKSEWGRSKKDAFSANLKTLNVIRRALNVDEVHRIGGLRIAKEAWDLLEKTYKSASISSKDEIMSSKEDTSLGSKAFMTLGIPKDSFNSASEFKSEEEDDEAEDIQEAFNKLFVESVELANTNKNLKKENKILTQEKKFKRVENKL